MPDHNAWIKKASQDLKACKKLLEDHEMLYIVSYHAQQCAEKALKSFLMFNKHPIIKTHDLQKLLDLCIKIEKSFELLKKESLTLIPYATYSRYPDDRFFIDYQEASQAIKNSEKILIFVKNKIELAIDPNRQLF
jgi:HEPN domain-containing protein